MDISILTLLFNSINKNTETVFYAPPVYSAPSHTHSNVLEWILLLLKVTKQSHTKPHYWKSSQTTPIILYIIRSAPEACVSLSPWHTISWGKNEEKTPDFNLLKRIITEHFELYSALIWFLSRMDHHMIIKSNARKFYLPHKLHLIWFLSRMNHHMIHKSNARKSYLTGCIDLVLMDCYRTLWTPI